MLFALEIQENYHYPELQHHGSGTLMELDIFLPKERLAFEYHGEKNYLDIHKLGNAWEKKQTSEEKRTICAIWIN